MRPPRIDRTVARALPDRQVALHRKAGRDHLAFVRALPCCSCGAPGPSIAAHYRRGMHVPMSKKDDQWVTPLCVPCHDKQHVEGGEATFWVNSEVPLSLSEALWRHTGDLDRGGRACLKAWQKLSALRLRR